MRRSAIPGGKAKWRARSGLLVGNEEGVEPVPIDELIAQRREEFRVVVRAVRDLEEAIDHVDGDRQARLREDHLRAMAFEVGTGKHRQLGPFHVDAEEVDGFAFGIFLQNRGEAAQRRLVFDDLEAVTAMLRGNAGVGRRIAVPLADFVEGYRAVLFTRGEMQIDVVRPAFFQADEVRCEWLDIDATPAALVERARDAVDIRIVRADVDIESVRPGKATGKHHVFKVLGIACNCHSASECAASPFETRPTGAPQGEAELFSSSS